MAWFYSAVDSHAVSGGARWPDRLSPRTADLICLAAAGLLLFALGNADATRFPFPWALAPVGASAALILCLRQPAGGMAQRVLSAPAIVYLGRLSYSLYLWHFAVIVLMRWTVGLDQAEDQIAAAAISLALAAFSFHLVEQPFRLSPRIARLGDGAVIGGVLAATGLGAALAAGLVLVRPWLSLSVTADATVWNRGAAETTHVDGCMVVRSEKTVAGVARVTFTPQDCARRDGRRLMAIGESHALAYQAMLQTVAGAEGMRVDIYYLERCQPFHFRDMGGSRQAAHCGQRRDTAIAEIEAEAAPGDILLLAGLRVPRFRETLGGEIAENATLGLESWSDGTASAEFAFSELKDLLDRGVRVIVEAPKPVFRIAPYRCADRFTRSSAYCAPGAEAPREELEARRAPIVATMRDFAAMHPAISIWDPFLTLCPGDVCSAYRDGLPLFYDGDHLSRVGNATLAPGFIEFIRRMQPDLAEGDLLQR